ncbi:hypothetical protein C5167_025496 [Papaver somniferum]|uniref:Homoserine dehydrogenase n=1 Tax=Papaver somniferum TaxID=3469 RepID=A0A4Y7JUK8_PAPSO|nr:hypothetical protein C5167_025496 [Papaver somniferum]
MELEEEIGAGVDSSINSTHKTRFNGRAMLEETILSCRNGVGEELNVGVRFQVCATVEWLREKMRSVCSCRIILQMCIDCCDHEVVAVSSKGSKNGTLSCIFNNFIEDRAFSEVVREAKNVGYTEPDPKDDLSGMDVARKFIILARESGLRLELSDIQVDSLVPEPLKSSASAKEFLRSLPEFDQEVAKKRLDAEAAGEVLRYVGVVDVVQNKE